MAEIKTMRILMYEAIRDVLANTVLTDAGWGFSSRAVVSEPSEAPQIEDYLSVRILVYNARLDMQPQTIYSADSFDDPELSIVNVQSRLQLQSYGARGMAWLDAFLHALEDPPVLEAFREAGFAVEADGAGAQDISRLLGARQQTRGLAYLTVTCRSVRERVITTATTIDVTTTLGPDEPVLSVLISESLE